jgi:adenosylcobinamide kinase/adenosylcobinamide-phosphate guanylyltransferase
MLAVLTGPVRSGKSGHALSLALAVGSPVVVAAAGLADDAEMVRRIERHRSERPAGMDVLEIEDPMNWLDRVPRNTVVVLDCLGTLVSRAVFDGPGHEADIATAEEERHAEERVDALVAALLAWEGTMIVIANEVGWGVVPKSAAGRLFRDVMGRATRVLVNAADVAWLVVAGRCIDLKDAAAAPGWPAQGTDAG